MKGILKWTDQNFTAVIASYFWLFDKWYCCHKCLNGTCKVTWKCCDFQIIPIKQFYILNAKTELLFTVATKECTMYNLTVKIIFHSFKTKCHWNVGKGVHGNFVYGKFFFSSNSSKLITDRGVQTIRNWPVTKILSVRTIWIADKLPNISEEKKNLISKGLIDSREYLRYLDIEKIANFVGIFGVFSPDFGI